MLWPWLPRVPPGFDIGTPCHSTPAEITRPYNRMFSLQFASRVLLFPHPTDALPQNEVLIAPASPRFHQAAQWLPGDRCCAFDAHLLSGLSPSSPICSPYYVLRALTSWIWSLGHHSRRTGSPRGGDGSTHCSVHLDRTCSGANLVASLASCQHMFPSFSSEDCTRRRGPDHSHWHACRGLHSVTSCIFTSHGRLSPIRGPS